MFAGLKTDRHWDRQRLEKNTQHGHKTATRTDMLDTNMIQITTF